MSAAPARATTAHAPAPSRSTKRRDRRRSAAVAVGVADVRRDPEEAAERVTQALLGAPARVLEERSGWVHVRLRDYEGWMRGEALAAPLRRPAQVGVVTRPRTTLYAQPRGDEPIAEIFATTVLPLKGRRQPREDQGRLRVGLPGGRAAWVAPDAVELRPAEQSFAQLGAVAVLTLAHELLGTPYLWGGVTSRGIDCSGFAQLCWRHAGEILPRDADQQYDAITHRVGRGELQPGDLLFFASGGAITHVAIALDGHRLIHASGSAGCVTINSLDPDDADYSARLAQMYAGARRPSAI